MDGARRIDPIRGARAAVGTLALMGLGALALPASTEAQVVGSSCGPLVSNTPEADQDPFTCSDADHLEWWSECAIALLQVRPHPEESSDDPWQVQPLDPWSPEDRFAERFVAECEVLRTAATTENRPLVDPERIEPHDHSRCPCSTAEHRAWVEGCLAEIDAILPGMKRWEVMERFGRDGGLNFPPTTRLRHCTCPLLKIDVEFELVPGEVWDSPRDLVRSVGDPYLEYPLAD